VTLLSAKVSREGGGEGPDFDHLMLRVDLHEPWLADVGFGESFVEPLRMNVHDKQVDPAGKFRLVAHAERLRLEKLEMDGQWKWQYSFSQQPHRLEDFADMCRYHHPLSRVSRRIRSARWPRLKDGSLSRG
jgi:N-hydroxyarylamine O-acetyltransferase